MAGSPLRPDYVIIQEVYGQGGAEFFEDELDQALEDEAKVIVIEPIKLGIETARWITVGNFLHKSSVLSGIACIIAASKSSKSIVVLPLGVTSFICAAVYLISWQSDPCCKYQIETDLTKMEKLPLHKLATSSPIILVRKDDRRRKILHNTIALTAMALCCWKIYKSYS